MNPPAAERAPDWAVDRVFGRVALWGTSASAAFAPSAYPLALYVPTDATRCERDLSRRELALRLGGYGVPVGELPACGHDAPTLLDLRRHARLRG